ncbi:MAG: DUF4435 domain-containing protein [Prevotella sp.]|nr:DUF4435 domain-containing protein [Prevotella sp.]
MGNRLKDNINSSYFEAANALKSKSARRRIAAYVESYDDIYFWRTVLSRFEDDSRYFEVMLPSHKQLERGKKSVLMKLLDAGAASDKATGGDKAAADAGAAADSRLGPGMIACVDADYDYLLQGATPQSKKVLESPYVFHTYAYAIENMQCYAPSLHDVCVAVTLNDHRIFDFEDYLRQYSEAIFPLFVWSVWFYRTGRHNSFSLTDFSRIVDPGRFNVQEPQPSIDHIRRKVATKVRMLQKEFPGKKEEYLATKESLKALGVTAQTTYLYIQGHHLFDTVLVPILTKVCNRLRQERQEEIQRTARHHTQRRNEMSCYEHSLQDIRQMLKKNTGYQAAPQFQRILSDLARLFADSH